MAVFKLTEEIAFPPPDLAEEDGLLAVGGDLGVERLLNAYALGIFPWYTEGYPILWWSPDPRMVLIPENFKRSKNLRRLVNKNTFEIRFDTNFEAVMRACRQIERKEQDGTWITNEMLEAYVKLHELGFAHSVETYYDKELVGGLYGIAIGKAFFGESMFHKKTDASKVALWHLVDKLITMDFDLIDAQQETSHLISLGATSIKREKFLTLLDIAIQKTAEIKKWTN